LAEPPWDPSYQIQGSITSCINQLQLPPNSRGKKDHQLHTPAGGPASEALSGLLTLDSGSSAPLGCPRKRYACCSCVPLLLMRVESRLFSRQLAGARGLSLKELHSLLSLPPLFSPSLSLSYPLPMLPRCPRFRALSLLSVFAQTGSMRRRAPHMEEREAVGKGAWQSLAE
jgi:hypothetical protein